MIIGHGHQILLGNYRPWVSFLTING